MTATVKGVRRKAGKLGGDQVRRFEGGRLRPTYEGRGKMDERLKVTNHPKRENYGSKA